MHLVKTALTYVAIFCVGAVTSVSCFVPEFENPSFRCNPSKAATSDVCPDAEVCCSDDPATTKGRLPNYFNGKNDAKYGVPIFSGANNPLSSSGMCVEVGGFTSPFTTGCPVPCNPKWTQPERDAICGVGSLCCQMQELDPAKDCVLDPIDNKWRAATGADIPKLTTWGDKQTTNQDPQGDGCTLFASNGGATAVDMAAQTDCFAQLTVADQRGFCYKTCPCIEDVCAMKNPGYVSPCLGQQAATQ
ncbi:MAG: hypothetical protein JNK56_28955 [Myxococcales bacterium]|nr:hypothetical protein [Myxococcales bacterium]